MPRERTLIIIKPSKYFKEVHRIARRRLENCGFSCVGKLERRITEEKARRLYSGCMHEPSFGSRIQFITSGVSIVSVWEGEGIIDEVNRILGPDDVDKAKRTCCLRGDLLRRFSTDPMHYFYQDYVYASKTLRDAKREIKIFFNLQPLESLEVPSQNKSQFLGTCAARIF